MNINEFFIASISGYVECRGVKDQNWKISTLFFLSTQHAMEKAAMPYVGIFQTSTIPGADTSIGVHPLRTEAQEDSHT